MSDVAFGLLFGVSLGNLVAVVMIFVVAAKGLKCLEEIRDLLKDRKGD
jgi:hypothetical protein